MAEKKSNLQTPEGFGCNTINPAYCMTCIFKNGEKPFADLPTKRYCQIYTRENGTMKPESVYFNGALCQYYSNENEQSEEDSE